MKNITVSIDEQVHRKARIRAAEKNTSLSAAVREFLIRFSDEETDYDRRKRLEKETLSTVTAFSGADRLSREEVHDRHALR